MKNYYCEDLSNEPTEQEIDLQKILEMIESGILPL